MTDYISARRRFIHLHFGHVKHEPGTLGQHWPKDDVMTADLQKDLRFGSVLIQVGLLTESDYQEASQLAIELGLPLGKVLVMSDFITDAQLSALVEAQSMLKDQLIDIETAARAVAVLTSEECLWSDALKKIDWTPPQVLPSNKLGSLLVEAEIISAGELEQSLEAARQSGLPLGRILSASGRLGEQLLYSCLNAQVLLRDGKITREQALRALRAAHARQLSIEQALVDVAEYKPPPRVRIKLGEMFVLAGLLPEPMMMDVIERGLITGEPIGQVLIKLGYITENDLQTALKLQEMVDAGTLNPINSSDALRQVANRGITIEQALGELNVRREVDVPQLGLADLLKLAGLVTEDDIGEALRRSLQSPEILGRILVMTGFVQETNLEIAFQCQQLMRQNMLSEDQSIIALNYCARMRCGLEQAAKDLGWTASARSAFTGVERTQKEDQAAAAAKQLLEYFD